LLLLNYDNNKLSFIPDCAVVGSGKTLAFTIPIIQKLGFSGEKRPSGFRKPRALVLSPTRELGLQIFNEIEKISDFIKCLAIYGGTSISNQQRELQRGVDVVIGTPGRINDLIERGDLDLSAIEIFGLFLFLFLFFSFFLHSSDKIKLSPSAGSSSVLVLDEADQMMGNDFKDQVEAIMKETPPQRQTFLFSATMPPAVKYPSL
jgi:superfamily II DNA/RNA helicase